MIIYYLICFDIRDGSENKFFDEFVARFNKHLSRAAEMIKYRDISLYYYIIHVIYNILYYNNIFVEVNLTDDG